MERIKLKALRGEKGLSIQEVANALNKSNAAYRRIENGASKLVDEDMVKLRDIYKCRLEDLIDIPGSENSLIIGSGQSGNEPDAGVQKLLDLMKAMQKKHEVDMVAIMKAFLMGFTEMIQKHKES